MQNMKIKGRYNKNWDRTGREEVKMEGRKKKTE